MLLRVISHSAMDDFTYNNMVVLNGQPDLIARFDYVRFCRPVLPSNVSAAVLLPFD